LDVLRGDREPLIRGMRALGRLQIARNTRYAQHFSVRVVQWHLRRQTPAGPPSRIQMQFELIHQPRVQTHDILILRGVDLAEAQREKLLGGLAVQRALVLETAALGQRGVGDHIARVEVLHEEDHVGHRVE
jgi:hypothetical protein